MIGPKNEPGQFLYVATQREGEERQNELVCRREKAKTKRRTGKLMITEGATLHKPTDKEVTRQKKVYLNGEQKLCVRERAKTLAQLSCCQSPPYETCGQWGDDCLWP